MHDGIFLQLTAPPVLVSPEPLERPAALDGLQDGEQRRCINPPSTVGHLRYELREILEYLLASLLSLALLPGNVLTVVIDLPDVLCLGIGFVACQLQPLLHKPLGKLLRVAEQVEVWVIGVVPWIRLRASVLITHPVSERLDWHPAQFTAHPLLYPDSLFLVEEGVAVIGTFHLPKAYNTLLFDEFLELSLMSYLPPKLIISSQFCLQALAWYVLHRQGDEIQPLTVGALLKPGHVVCHECCRPHS